MSTIIARGPGNNVAIIHFAPSYRLRLRSGGCVYMEYHDYCGPALFSDRQCRRAIEDWWENDEICEALDWFVNRGCRG